MSRAQIIALAESGVPQATIASRCGVSASYVSQILHEDSLKTKVLEAQLSLLDERTQRDAKYDAIEDTLLDKLKAKLPDIYKPQDILRSLIAINKAERRGATSQQLAEIANQKESTVVTLELPERIRTRIIKSHTKEIISVNERALITKDSRVLLQEINEESEIDPLDVDLLGNDESASEGRHNITSSLASSLEFKESQDVPLALGSSAAPTQESQAESLKDFLEHSIPT